MPALPEIEVLHRDLEREVVGRRIKEVDVRPGTNAMKVIPRHGRRKELQDLLVEAKIERVERIGRLLIMRLDNGRALVFDLGTSGRLLKTSASEDIANHTHMIISFTIGGQLRFLDPQRTGEVFVVPLDELMDSKGVAGFQIDPLDGQNPVTWQYLATLLQQQEAEMKRLMMDESFIVGLGPMYSDEVLFGAGIRHDHLSSTLSSQDVRRLYRSLVETLQEAVKARGTSAGEDDFLDLQGAPGEYRAELKVYEREGESCPRCRSTIVKEKFAGADTYFCPQCQS